MLTLGLLSAASAWAIDQGGQVEQWGTFDASLGNPGPAPANPFTDVQLTATFTQGATSLTVEGFYDGPDRGYHVRFMPPTSGAWNYLTACNLPALDGRKGIVHVLPPGHGDHGPVQVAHTFHFAYADGTPFDQVGTTSYSWAFAGDAREEETLRTLAASPFNKLRMCVLPQDFAPVTDFPYVGTPPRHWDTTRFNPAFFRHLELRIGQLRDQGIEADLILFHPYDKRWGFSDLSPAEDERYLRYVIARFAAYRNVWWSMANEYDFIRSKRESDWDRIFQIVEKYDPYHHLRSIHNGAKIYNNNHPWVTHASIQNGAAVEDPERAILYRDVYRKPVVYDEVKYEGDIARRWGQLTPEELVLRFWSGTVAGTYVGHSEVFRKSTYLARGVSLHDAEASWLGSGGDLVGASPPRLAFLRRVMEEGPAEGIEPIDKWQDRRTGGQPGKYYLVYLGKEAPTSWTFDLYKEGLRDGMRFQVDVLDTWNMTVTPAGSYTIKRQGNYDYVDRQNRSVPLPGKPYQAIRIRRIESAAAAVAPAFDPRGVCIGMQKTYVLPGRKVYEYPYTPELFPFFYDRGYWQRYLDFLAANHYNTLYLWAGHPFASLVRVPAYPGAVEVPDDVFARNVAMYHFVVDAARQRGIRIVQGFYNILLSKPFAERHHLPTQLKAPTPVAADYTRKSIAAFVAEYPGVGLLVTLGEALQGQENQTHWFTDVILPGVKDGMAAAHLAEAPLVVLRAHATDASVVLPAALRVYPHLDTMEKFNGESLTTWEPRGPRQQLSLTLSREADVQISNIHILADLEPFRYGAPRFIQKCVQAARDRLGARGIHVYPLSYWGWPYSPDKTEPRLAQIDRDWIWFEAWARYAVTPDVDPVTDRAFWIHRIAEVYGNAEAAAKILDAYNDSGECAPRLIRRFGITEGNRQTFALGMTLDELVRPGNYHAFPELWEDQAPPGERLPEYADREWAHQPHVGETPPDVISAVDRFSGQAAAEIDAAAPLVAANRPEFERLRNDVHCIREMSLNYIDKARAALLVLRYGHSHDRADLVQARTYLAESLAHYRTLAALTQGSYLYANSMQTSMRKIPVNGVKDGQPAYYHWTQLVPLYERELADFDRRLASADGSGTS